MTFPTDEELNYMDIAWFAADAEGRIAVLFSGGTNNMVRSPATTEEGGDLIFEYINGLLPLSEAVADAEMLAKAGEYGHAMSHVDEEYASRGLYVYDAFRHLTGSPNQYIRTTYPTRPVFLSQLEAGVTSLLRTIQSDSLSFDRMGIIDILDISKEITKRDDA